MPRSLIDHYIETQNIAAFRLRLRIELDPLTRATLLQLLSEEEGKHAAGNRIARDQLEERRAGAERHA